MSLSEPAAGITAAKTIRQLRPADEIVVVSRDDQVHSAACFTNIWAVSATPKESALFRPAFLWINNINWFPDAPWSGWTALRGASSLTGTFPPL